MPESTRPESYEITTQDIKSYLATLAPTAAAGDNRSDTACLVANALQHKYGQRFAVGYTSFGSVRYGGRYPLGDGVGEVVGQFDGLGSRFPSRQQVEEAIPELKA